MARGHGKQRHAAAGSRQTLVHYLGAGSYRRFSPERGRDVSVPAKTWFLVAVILTGLLILLGVWQETRGGNEKAGTQPAAASAFRP